MRPPSPSSRLSPSAGDAEFTAECGWDATLTGASEALRQAVGWRELPDGADLYQLVHPDCRPAVEHLWHAVNAGRTGHPAPVRLAGDDASARRFFLRLTVVPGQQGGRRRLTAEFAADDGRQDLLDALESAQSRFSFLYEATSDLVVMLSEQDEILAANPAFEALTGLEVEAFYRGESGWPDVVIPEDLDQLLAAFRRARETRARAQVLCRVRGPGQYFWHEFAVHPIEAASGRRGLFCTARDVHHLKLAEESQRMQAVVSRDRQLEALRRMERMKGMVAALAETQGGRVEFVRGLRRCLTGMFPGMMVLIDLPGSSAGDAAPTQGGLLDSALSRLLHEFRLPVMWSRPADAPATIDPPAESFLGVPVFDAPGSPAGMICVAGDFTHEFSPADADTLMHAAQLLSGHIGQWRRGEERDRLERQVQTERKMEALGRLAGGISHDFNNLVSIILNYSQYALKALPADSPAAADIQVVQQTAEQAADLTRKLMQFARAKPAAPAEVDLNALVLETLEVLSHGVRKDVALVPELSPGLPRLLGDATQLKQLVLNLGLNAGQAIPGTGGRVVFRTSLQPVPRRLRDALPPSEGEGRKAVLLEVEDNGTGIPPDVLPRIFEAFTTTKREGVGLGLSIVKNVTSQHGGALEVESEPGQGATFRVWLPVRVKPAG